LVSAFMAAAALAQAVGDATNYASTALLFVEPYAATLAVVSTTIACPFNSRTIRNPTLDRSRTCHTLGSAPLTPNFQAHAPRQDANRGVTGFPAISLALERAFDIRNCAGFWMRHDELRRPAAKKAWSQKRRGKFRQNSQPDKKRQRNQC